MGRIGTLGLCSFDSPYSLGGRPTPQSAVASKVNFLGFLQYKQFVQCGCRVSFKYVVGLFVVNKYVHYFFVVYVIHTPVPCLQAV